MARIAVVLQGDATDPQAWSGTPAGICAGLTAAGVEPVPIDARPPGSGLLDRALRMSWIAQTTNPAVAAAGGLSAEVAMRVAGRIDGAIKIGSGFTLSSRVPVVTYEDMTVVQALAQPDPAYASLSDRASRRWRDRQGRIYRRSRACCAASTWVARSIRDDYGVEPERVHVVGLGHSVAVRRVERDWTTPRFIFIGVDWERKRGDAVVEAFAEVRRRHPAASLDLVGGHPAIEAPGVVPHGRLSLASKEDRQRLEGLLARATCLVVPSEYEPFGIVYLEAAASGIPSIGTTVGGAPDAIGDGGRLVDPGDPGALPAAMLELADPETARRLGEAARARVPLFSWRAVAERLVRALEPAGVDVSTLPPFLEPPGRSPGPL